MPGIDEELGRYLDSLVEPVEPEWVIGWVARRRRRRAAIVGVGAVVVAVAAGSMGYALHSPGPSSSIHVANGGSSSSVESSSSSTAASSSTTSTVPTSRPHTTGPSTSVPLDPHYPWPIKALADGDVSATLTFATDTFVSGVPVDATVTLVNQTDQGVVIRNMPETDVAIITNGAMIAVCDPQLYWPDYPGAQGVLGPRETVTATCSWIPPDTGALSVTVGLQNMEVPSLAFTQTPVQIDVASPPETTTTTSAPPDTTTTT